MTGASRHISKYDRKNVESARDGRLFSPSFERNFDPICKALSCVLGTTTGSVLEIGSGTGQHIAYFAQAFPAWSWTPSDYQADHLTSIHAWKDSLQPPNLMDPVVLDAATEWADRDDLRCLSASAIFSANVIHIAPWPVAQGIVRESGRLLPRDGTLIFYGPFKECGENTGEGNIAFDRSLRSHDPNWGIRDLDDLSALAIAAGFGPPAITPMPSNNRFVVYRRG